jgi:subtilisin
MAQYVLVNRRAGKFTKEAKTASRASIASAMAFVSPGEVLQDSSPKDETARRVVVLDLDDAAAQKLAAETSEDAILEPLVRRKLHHRFPRELEGAVPLQTVLASVAGSYTVRVTGDRAPLPDTDVMFYVANSFGQMSTSTIRTDANGRASISLAPGQRVAFAEPIPYAGCWIMLAEAPPSEATIDCIALAQAPADRRGWWHVVTATGNQQDGAGIKVGVIDTGCGPHPNLAHVTLAGVFTNGVSLPPEQATDVAEHGTHTTGLIGARPTRQRDFIGMAPAATLFHVRVFASEEEGPSQADLIQAIDKLSRDCGCDLINMSLGGGPPSGAEEDCIRDAMERGTLCICSAGNNGGPVNYPAAYPECISVSALGQVGWAPPGTFSAGNRPREPGKLGRDNLFLATFSSFGEGLVTCGPGVGIISTVPDHGGATDLYMEMDGTSMASPAVCATLATILSKDPNYADRPRDLSRAQAARQLLEANCVSLGLSRSFQGLGLPVAGSLNAQVLGGQVAISNAQVLRSHAQVLDHNSTRQTRKRKARA